MHWGILWVDYIVAIRTPLQNGIAPIKWLCCKYGAISDAADVFVSVRAAVGQLDANVFPLLLIGSEHTRTKHPDWSTEALSSSPKTKSSSPLHVLQTWDPSSSVLIEAGWWLNPDLHFRKQKYLIHLSDSLARWVIHWLARPSAWMCLWRENSEWVYLDWARCHHDFSFPC